jgi:hypothetical protein
LTGGHQLAGEEFESVGVAGPETMSFRQLGDRFFRAAEFGERGPKRQASFERARVGAHGLPKMEFGFTEPACREGLQTAG